MYDKSRPNTKAGKLVNFRVDVPSNSELQNLNRKPSQILELRKNKGLKLIHINTQCLRNKILELEVICESEDLDIICINEHWCNVEELPLYIPVNYDLGSAYCRNIFKNGGSCILVKKRYKI